MDSSRLPKKMSAELGNLTIIEWVLFRIKKSKLLDNIVLATSTHEEDDELIDVAKKHNINYFRGSKENVLGRFLETAYHFKANHIVRVCADNPFICPEVVDDLVKYYLLKKYDLVFNHSPLLKSKFADGFGAEILSLKMLSYLSKKILLSSHKEHVTKYIYDNCKDFKISTPPCPNELSFPNLRFDIDEIKDLDKLNKFIKDCKINIDTSAKEIVKLYLNNDL